MFRELRRSNQAIPEDECIQILKRQTFGVLALDGDDNYPYAVPMSYVYHDNKIYFHCAQSGHKIDSVHRNDKASFCVTDLNEIVPEQYTTYYRSVIVFGHIRICETEAEKREILGLIIDKYSPDETEGRQAEIDKTADRVCIMELDIEHMSGKEAKELHKRR